MFNKKNPMFNVIKYDGPKDGSQWLVYKYPGNQFTIGSQLIVGMGQEALFVKGGEALDLFTPNTYTLQTGNLPILNKLVNLPFGGETPFSAEVYFVNMTSRLNMNWGTANPIALEDPKYNILLSIRSHGTFGIRINDSRMFLNEIIGSIPGGMTATHEYVGSYLSGLITTKVKNIIASYMIKNRLSFLEVAGYLEDISRDCKNSLNDEFDRFGAELVNFYVESITPPKEEYEKLRALKEEMALGHDIYREKRSLDILEAMANNDNAASIANAGVGLGMGIGVAQNAGQLFQNIGSNFGSEAQNTNQPEKQCPHCGAMNPVNQKFCGTCGQSLNDEVKCPKCGHLNDKNQKFCGECGTKLINVCPNCGKENDLNQKFCGECGTKL